MPEVKPYPCMPDVTNAEKWRLLAEGLRLATPRPPEEALVVMVAHLLLEHARDLSGLYNFSAGNVKWTPAQRAREPGVDYFWLHDRHDSDDTYRAFETLPEGLGTFCHQVLRRPSLLACATEGRAADYGEQLLVTDYVGPGYPPYAHQYATRDLQVRDLRAMMHQLGSEVLVKRRVDPLGAW